MKKEQLQQIKDQGLTGEDLEKALQEAGVVSEEDMQKALAELESLEKADGVQEEDLDSLLKSLEEEEAAMDELLKSGDDDDDDDEDGDDDGDESFGKSLDNDLEEELIKASEAYAQLEETIQKSMGSIQDEVRAVHRAQLSSMNLQIKTAKALAQLTKSMEALSAAPAGRAAGVLGIGDSGDDKGALKKSKSEIQADLIKAVHEKRVDARFLSTFAVRGPDALPDYVKKEIGL